MGTGLRMLISHLWHCCWYSNITALASVFAGLFLRMYHWQRQNEASRVVQTWIVQKIRTRCFRDWGQRGCSTVKKNQPFEECQQARYRPIQDDNCNITYWFPRGEQIQLATQPCCVFYLASQDKEAAAFFHTCVSKHCHVAGKQHSLWYKTTILSQLS